MPTTYKGATVPVSTDLADGPDAFRDFTDSFASIDALEVAQVPIGTILLTCRATAPTGYLLLDGTTYTSADTLYPDLWAVVPTGWKSGTSLVLPDGKGKFPVGVNSADTSFDALGEVGGAKTHTIAAANLPPHAHTFSDSATTGVNSADHVHTAGGGSIVTTTAGGGVYAPGIAGTGAGFTSVNNVDHTHSVSVSGNTGNGPGTSTPITHLPPYLVLQLMIRAL
jgi:microcystin-dependent protein